ncbi:MAG: glycosyltransferase family 2 protein [Saprospiraceae bacterium]
MLTEGLSWILRLTHFPLEVYIVVASLYVLLPALIYPFFAQRIRSKMEVKPKSENSISKFIIVTPAHNEGECIENLIKSIQNQNYPKNKYRHLVVADNCSDHTAPKVIKLGAEVFERQTDAPSDKTQALRYVSDIIRKESTDADYVIVIDADCTLPAHFLSALSEAIEENPSGAYQTYRNVSNAAEGALPAMDAAAEELRQVINLGVKDCLGLDAHLHGNGTAYRIDLFHACAQARQEPFADDKAWKATLTQLGEHVKWVGNAPVEYAAVTESSNFQNQRKRWITGQIEMIRTYSLPMIRLGLKRKDKSALEFGFSMLQLPRAILFLSAGYLFAVSAIAPTLVFGHAAAYFCLGGCLFGYGLLGYAVGGIPLHP